MKATIKKAEIRLHSIESRPFKYESVVRPKTETNRTHSSNSLINLIPQNSNFNNASVMKKLTQTYVSAITLDDKHKSISKKRNKEGFASVERDLIKGPRKKLTLPPRQPKENNFKKNLVTKSDLVNRHLFES